MKFEPDLYFLGEKISTIISILVWGGVIFFAFRRLRAYFTKRETKN
jgi:hypothetical protein